MDPDVNAAAPVDAPVLDYAATAGGSSKWGKGFLAVAGTILFMGLGHWIVGRGRRGLFWVLLWLAWLGLAIATSASARLILVSMIVLLSEIPLQLGAMADAFLCGRRSQRALLGAVWKRYVAGLVLIGITLAFNVDYYIARRLQRDYFETYVTSGGAILPTLQAGDCFMAHKRADLERWDLVVITHPEHGEGVPIASRLVGLPGETVEIVNGGIKINSTAVTLPSEVSTYVSMKYFGRHNPLFEGEIGAGCEGNPIHLADDEYFVLGDNSNSALDARLWEATIPGHQWGALPRDHIIGRVTTIYWPPGHWRLFYDWP